MNVHQCQGLGSVWYEVHKISKVSDLSDKYNAMSIYWDSQKMTKELRVKKAEQMERTAPLMTPSSSFIKAFAVLPT